jgi:uncharacterized lipoprotein YehR (DUF1307 family)
MFKLKKGMLSALLAIILVLTFTACEDGEGNNPSNGEITQPTEEERQYDGGGWQSERFEGGSSGGVSVIDEGEDEIVITDEQEFTIDDSVPGGGRDSGVSR